MQTPYENLLAAALAMTVSGGNRFDNAAQGIAALDRAALHFGGPLMRQLETELAKFAEDHAFAHRWVGFGTDDEGNEPPVSAELNAVMEYMYE